MSPPAARLRTFEFERDWASVRDVWARCGPGVQFSRSDDPQEILKKLERDPDLFLVAEAEGAIVGAVMGGFDGRRGLVYHLAVVPEQRGRGIGVALMHEVEARLKAKGCLKCYLLVTRENAAVVEFYRAQGWGVMEMFLMGKELA